MSLNGCQRGASVSSESAGTLATLLSTAATSATLTSTPGTPSTLSSTPGGSRRKTYLSSWIHIRRLRRALSSWGRIRRSLRRTRRKNGLSWRGRRKFAPPPWSPPLCACRSGTWHGRTCRRCYGRIGRDPHASGRCHRGSGRTSSNPHASPSGRCCFRGSGGHGR